MSSTFPLRRRIELMILFFLVLIAFASASSGYWIQWAFLAGVWGVLVLVDFAFLAQNSFVYDPDYTSWASKTQGTSSL